MSDLDSVAVFIPAGKYLSISSAAEQSKFQPGTIRGWARDGYIKSIKIGGMGYLVEVESLKQYADLAEVIG